MTIRTRLVRFSQPRSLDIEKAEGDLLTRLGRSGGLGYSGEFPVSKDRRDAKRLVVLDHAGLVDFIDAASGGWEPGTWAARLTYRGWNSLFAWTGIQRGTEPVHVGRVDLSGTRRAIDCGAPWSPDGTCSGCGAVRPLDTESFEAFIETLAGDDLDAETRAPQLLCIEHGRMRLSHITTQKVCALSGTPTHDRGLERL